MTNQDISQLLQQKVREAYQNKQPLKIVGGNSKEFYGHMSEGEILSVAQHSGIIEYEPSELVVTVRAGTAIAQLEKALTEHHQMLAFEPPHFGEHATVGGMVACGLSGSSRPFVGAVRDHMLGCKILNGKGELLNFGGQVIKNVAGYDASRLMVGAMGTLGVLLEVSLKVLPIPDKTVTLLMPAGNYEALDIMSARSSKPLPITAASYDGDSVLLRLQGAEAAITDARKMIAGDILSDDGVYWLQLREQTHYFFNDDAPLWRISLAPATLPIGLTGRWLFDWGGGLRWLKSYEPAKSIRDAVQSEGGHATLFRRGKDEDDTVSIFQPLPKSMMKYHQRIKAAFDPEKILNPHRLYSEF